jgi:plastocyanin
MNPTVRCACVLFLASAALAAPALAAGQSLLDRTPNVSGGWVGGPHNLHFTFMHRFNESGPPRHQVVNRPTFLLAYGAPAGILIGAQYATRSDVVLELPNEWEAFARYAVLSEDRAHPLDVSAELAWNHAAESVDGELSVARRMGPLRVLGAARALSSPYGGDDARYVLAGGATLRLGQWLALAGDYGRLLDREDDEEAAWGVAIQFGIPLTPHTLSLQAANTNSATLQGSSRGADEIRYGFEFTVPVTLARYFGSREPAADEEIAAAPPAADSTQRALIADSVAAALDAQYALRWREDSLRIVLRDDSARLGEQLAAVRAEASADSVRRAADVAAQREAAGPTPAAAAAPTGETVRVNIRNLAFSPARIEIDAGTTVVWRNNDQVVHTVTSTNRSFDSGSIDPGKSWQRTFSQPGTYSYICTPHPFMKGTVIVRAK